ncbi:MAG: glycosyltransferase family 39 protein [Planctomycetes bacterium]|nr:glycosyltransferase family 39 protein [Planctomycetota bacterium]
MSPLRRPFALVLVPFLLLESYLAVALPPYAGTDEVMHVVYEEFMRRERRIPDPFLDQVGNDKHPPLYYALAAVLVEGTERIAPLLPDSLPLPGPFVGEISLARREKYFRADVSGASLLAMRFLSIACAAVALLFVRRCALLLEPGAHRAAAGVTAFVAFNPLFLLQGAIANNDAASVTVGAAAAWLLLRGLTPRGPVRPFLAGAVAGLGYLVKANCVVLLPIGLLALFVRRKREGARPRVETALFLAGWILLAGAWLARNLIRLGEPLGVGGVVATWGGIFFPGPKTWPLLDTSLGDLFFAFWEPGPVWNAGRVARLVFGSVVAAALLGTCLRILHRGVRDEAPAQAHPLLLSLAAGACFYLLVAAGNLSVPSTPGRLLFPGVGFLGAVLAAGLPAALRVRADAIGAPLGGAAGLAGLVFFFGLLLPKYLLPKSAFTRDTIAYVDCGHPASEASVKRGMSLQPGFLFGWTFAAYTAAVDGERVEVEAGGLDPSVPMRLEVTYASADVTYDDAYVGDFVEHVVRPVVQRLCAGEVELHGPLTVTHHARTYAYRVPPDSIREGRLRLAFHKVSGLYATVSEVRLRRDPTRLEASLERKGEGNLAVRVVPAGTEASLVAGWFTPVSDPSRLLGFHVHPARPGAEILFESSALPAGRYRFAAALVDPDASPFASVEAETLPHPGWRVFADPKAFERYVIRATEGWTKPGDSIPFSLPGVPAGAYLAGIRYSSKGAGGSAGLALGADLPDTGGGFREVRTLLEADGGTVSGTASFGGRGRLALDRFTLTAAAGPCARPDATLEFEVP